MCLTESETKTYNRLKKADLSNCKTLDEKKILIRESIKAAERYKQNQLAFKSDKCIYCKSDKIYILKNTNKEFANFKCTNCLKYF